jgi:RNA polymerase sigma-70 factor (ECF subfamily)
VFDLRQRQARPGQGSGDSSVQRLLEENAVADSDQSAWDREYQQRLFAWAAEQVRPRCEEATWQAFWLTAVEGAAAAEVARRLNLAVAAVYLAKSRVMARLREQIEAVEET